MAASSTSPALTSPLAIRRPSAVASWRRYSSKRMRPSVRAWRVDWQSRELRSSPPPEGMVRCGPAAGKGRRCSALALEVGVDRLGVLGPQLAVDLAVVDA